MIKKLVILMLCLTLLASALPAQAAPKVLYNARITTLYNDSYTNVYQKPDKNSKVLTSYNPGHPIQIVEVLPNYVGILYGKGVAYVLRHRIENPVSTDIANIPRFGTEVNVYYTTVNRDTPVMSAPKSDADTLITLHEGAMIGFISMENGWARTIFKRQYGYVDTRLLDSLLPVADSIDKGTADMPIAVYNSFYKITEDEANLNRINNLMVGCQRMTRTMQPGEELDFNGQVGPFTRANGYKEANALLNGEVISAFGGGSCQISSTLYNTVLQLTGLTVLVRSPHGTNGAPYLPHGVDASSGRLNFVFRNDYDFPITIKTHVQDGSLFVAIYKGSAL